MSTVSTLKTRMDFYLGATNAYSSGDKLVGLNEARKHILMNYDVDEFVVTTTLTFTSGKATIPTDYLRWVRMFDSTTKTREFMRVDVNEFDKDLDDRWTIKDDSGTRKIHIYPTDLTSEVLRYVKLPTDLSVDSDSTGFNAYWDSAHAAWASWWVLMSDRQDASATMIEVAKELSETALRHQDNEIEKNTSLSTAFDDDKLFFLES